MTRLAIEGSLRESLLEFLRESGEPELVTSYLHYIERGYQIQPVLSPRHKTIFLDADHVVEALEEEGKLWHEAKITVHFGEESVNEETKRIYICPFTGKVFGDNTHPNPQDAIYDWVSKCPENTERERGLRVKRFYVSEDPEVIKGYIDRDKPQEPMTRTVFSSLVSGKLFGSKRGVIDDFKVNYLKRMTLFEVQNQNRHKIDDRLMNFLQEHLTEEKITAFVESLAEDKEFLPYVERWIEE